MRAVEGGQTQTQATTVGTLELETSGDLDSMRPFDDEDDPKLAPARLEPEGRDPRTRTQEALASQPGQQLPLDHRAQGEFQRTRRRRQMGHASRLQLATREKLTHEETLDDPLSTLPPAIQRKLEDVDPGRECPESSQRGLAPLVGLRAVESLALVLPHERDAAIVQA